MECLEDWNKAALHFTGCYLLMKRKEKKFTLKHSAATFVCIEEQAVHYNTFYNSFKRK